MMGLQLSTHVETIAESQCPWYRSGRL